MTSLSHNRVSGVFRVVSLAACLALPASSAAQDTIRVRITTELGVMTAELYAKAAPVTVANFLRYVDAGFYANGQFHRTVRPDNQPASAVRIEVVQAAADRPRARGAFAPISLERTSVTGLRHRDGTLSMARSSPDSGTHEFFVCIGDQPELDFGGKRNADGQGFAAFGRVLEGMDVVRRIQAAPAEAQRLTPPIRIVSIERVKPSLPATAGIERVETSAQPVWNRKP